MIDWISWFDCLHVCVGLRGSLYFVLRVYYYFKVGGAGIFWVQGVGFYVCRLLVFGVCSFSCISLLLWILLVLPVIICCVLDWMRLRWCFFVCLRLEWACYYCLLLLIVCGLFALGWYDTVVWLVVCFTYCFTFRVWFF